MLFQFMPRLSDDEYAALEKSIAEHGIQVPILVDESRAVIDGHHRKEIADRLGLDCPRRFAMDLTETQKRTLALSLNLDRRHLSREQRRELVAASLTADPQLSDREHARRTGTSHPTVAAMRGDLEESGDVESFSTRTDSAGRQQPASRPAPVAVDTETGEVTDDPQPARPPAPPRAPSRRALADDARDAGQELRKVTERLQRLASDDRLTRNKDEVAAHLRHHLEQALQVCQDLSDLIN